LVSDVHKAELVRAEPHDVDDDRMHPMVRMAMRNGAVDPATLGELMALQREWQADEARKAFTRAKTALMRDLPTVIKKDATVKYTPRNGNPVHYTHASLAGVMNAITEPLTRHGFALSWTPSITEKGSVRVTCRLTHAEGHHEEATLEAKPDDSGNKSGPQAIASTQTLLQRYTALGLLGIATADMKEPTGEQAEEAPDARIDGEKNLRAVAAIQKAKRTSKEFEEFIGRPVSQWTGDDRSAIHVWLEIVNAAYRDQLLAGAKRYTSWIRANEARAWPLIASVCQRLGIDVLEIETAFEPKSDG
jgi:hypothetical protein